MQDRSKNASSLALLSDVTVTPLTSKQAATLLGVSSANTVKNWLEGG